MPDINPIKNLWVILVQRVYVNEKQFKTNDQLKITLIRVWNELKDLILQCLCMSINNRIFEFIIKNSFNSKY